MTTYYVRMWAPDGIQADIRIEIRAEFRQDAEAMGRHLADKLGLEFAFVE